MRDTLHKPYYEYTVQHKHKSPTTHYSNALNDISMPYMRACTSVLQRMLYLPP